MNEPLWRPSEDRIRNTVMYRFMTEINERHSTSFEAYDELWQWSVDNVDDFWASLWDYFEIVSDARYSKVVDSLEMQRVFDFV